MVAYLSILRTYQFVSLWKYILSGLPSSANRDFTSLKRENPCEKKFNFFQFWILERVR